MAGRTRELVVGFLAVVALAGCSDSLGRTLGEKVEAGGTTTPTLVALPPRMTASTTAAPATTAAPGSPVTVAASTQPLAPATSQLRDPATTAATSPARSAAPTTEAPAPATPRPTAVVGPLQVSLTENPFRCDSTRRAFGTVSNALAGEQVGFYASGIGELVPGSADGNGDLTIHWRCDPGDAGAVWAVTATGIASGRFASFQFKGTAPNSAATPPTTVAGAKTLTVALSENPFRCDGLKARVFGRISGATPGETVGLTESFNGPLVSGVADSNGEFSVRWSCPSSSAGAVWTITATGNSSGRTARFSFTGA